jgi:large subunit ribosomal protein L35
MGKPGKTRKAVAKRFKKTANGKLKFHSPGRRHLASSKSRKRKRQLAKPNIACKGDAKRLLPSIASYK